MQENSNEKNTSLTRLIETTVYKIIGVKNENLNYKPISTKRDLINLSNEFRRELEDNGYELTTIKNSFAAVTNKVKAFYKEKTDKQNISKKVKWVKSVFFISKQEIDTLNKNYKIKVEEKMENRNKHADNEKEYNCDRVLDVKGLYELGEKMLKSARWQDVATALAFFTGRRMIEIIYFGEFSKGKNSKTLMFKGASKKRYNYSKGESNEMETYEIPCLIDNQKILAGFKMLEIAKSKQSIYEQVIKNRSELMKNNNLPNGFITEMELAKIINNTFHSTLNNTAKDFLKGKFIKISGAVNFHDLRKIYFNLCVLLHKKTKGTSLDYAKKILLHENTEAGLTYDTIVIDNINL